MKKTWEEKEEENQRVYDAAKKIIASWPRWKQAIAKRAINDNG